MNARLQHHQVTSRLSDGVDIELTQDIRNLPLRERAMAKALERASKKRVMESRCATCGKDFPVNSMIWVIRRPFEGEVTVCKSCQKLCQYPVR